MARLQEEKAQKENERMITEQLEVEEIDDDLIHIDEHTRFVLSEYNGLSDEQKTRFYNHLKEHKERVIKADTDTNKENIKGE